MRYSHIAYTADTKPGTVELYDQYPGTHPVLLQVQVPLVLSGRTIIKIHPRCHWKYMYTL